MKKIILDLYGADAGTAPILDGAALLLDSQPEIGLTVIGNKAVIETALNDYIAQGRVEILETDDFITNTEPPTAIYRGRDHCSVAMGLDTLKNDPDTIGFLSAGNTAVLLIGSILRLGLKPDLKTPILSAAIPRLDGRLFCLLDCGANVTCTPQDLVKFAHYGNEFIRCMYGGTPKVALLNIGVEEGKGNDLTKAAYELLKSEDLHFIGNVEGSSLVSGEADVVVCDGFSGNLMLKNIEGTGRAAQQIVDHFRSENPTLCEEIITRLASTFNLNDMGGATFLGTRKPIIKMHGCANKHTVLACAEQLFRLMKGGILDA